jgi:hypothetical protein
VRAREDLPREPEELAPETVRPAETGVLELQRLVGNQAVSAMLARAPTEEKAATMTAGLGDEIGVIPIDSFGWGQSGNPGTSGGKGHSEVREASISFTHNAASAAIAQAANDGRSIKQAFISTSTATIDFFDVVLGDYSDSDHGTTVTLSFASMKFRQ